MNAEREIKVCEAGKLKWDLLPIEAVSEIVKVMEFGAAKYGAFSWYDEPTSYAERFASILRHVFAWWRGEARDPQSCGLHLAHAACQILFLITYTMRGKGEDNRPLIF